MFAFATTEIPQKVRHTVRITPAAFQAYKESIAVNPPETFALIGGSLDDPMLITDFHFMAPRRDEQGRFVVSGAFVYPDHEQVNYIIDNVLVKKGHYILGLWHSHPGGMNSPSAPDLDFCGRIIGNDDSEGRRWNYFLAPITTFNESGQDMVTAWVLPKGGERFEPARYSVEAVPAVAPDRTGLATRDRAPHDCGSVLNLVERTYQLAHTIERTWENLGFMQAYRVSHGLAHAQSIVDMACRFEIRTSELPPNRPRGVRRAKSLSRRRSANSQEHRAK
jgi:Prokaryotic homologs of the JAB domain